MEIFLTVGIGVFVLAVLGALVTLYPCIEAFKWGIVFVGSLGFFICLVLAIRALINNFSLYVFRHVVEKKIKQGWEIFNCGRDSTWGSSAYSTFGVYGMAPGSFARQYGWWRFWTDRIVFEGFFPERKERMFPGGTLPKLEQINGKNDFKDFLREDIALLIKLRKETTKEEINPKLKFSTLMEMLRKGEWSYEKSKEDYEITEQKID
jgi:hypothetical protein